jgi:hypothetical protein
MKTEVLRCPKVSRVAGWDVAAVASHVPLHVTAIKYICSPPPFSSLSQAQVAQVSGLFSICFESLDLPSCSCFSGIKRTWGFTLGTPSFLLITNSKGAKDVPTFLKRNWLVGGSETLWPCRISNGCIDNDFHSSTSRNLSHAVLCRQHSHL